MAATVASAMAASTSSAPTELNDTLFRSRGRPAGGALAEGDPEVEPVREPEPEPDPAPGPGPEPEPEAERGGDADGCADDDPPEFGPPESGPPESGPPAPGEATGTLEPVGLSGGGG